MSSLYALTLISLTILAIASRQHQASVSTELTADDASLNAVPNIPNFELSALESLYVATAGDFWNWGQQPGAHWNFSTPNPNPCFGQWQGINCTEVADSNGFIHVSDLRLSAYNLTGPLVPEIGNLTQLVQLILSRNALTGSIPSTVEKLIHLGEIDLSSNKLSGTLPGTIGGGTQLLSIDLSSNQLHGAINTLCAQSALIHLNLTLNAFAGSLPACISSLTSLQYLDLSSNRFSAAVPAEINSLTQLQLFDLSGSKLNGSLPSLLNLTMLEDFDVSENSLSGAPPVLRSTSLYSYNIGNNQFTGEFPDFGATAGRNLSIIICSYNDLTGELPVLDDLPQLSVLHLRGNGFTGTLPTFTSVKLPKLRLFDVSANAIDGTMSSGLQYLPSLQWFAVNINLLSGTIPEEVGTVSRLTGLDISENFFYGTLPNNMVWSNLTTLVAGRNYLTGTLPTAMCSYTRLAMLEVGANYFVGPVPQCLVDDSLPRLSVLYLSDNQFYGNLPSNWSPSSNLSFIYLSNNRLTGTVPAALGNLRYLTSLNLGNNHLTGIIPASLSSLQHLEALVLEYNQFSGTLDDVFNSTLQTQLSAVILTGNGLFGTLPEHLFEISALLTFAAVGNCFSGTLPTTICKSVNLQTLALDGLHSAGVCQEKVIFNIFTNSYILRSAFSLSGSIPTCLMQIPTLFTLHLSGNGFSGSLPQDVVVSSTLSDLSLSNNAFVGSIPAYFTQRFWQKLDLSFNRLTFGESTNYSVTELKVQQNRMSGKVPDTILSIQHLKILDGNLFTCSADRSDLPQRDPAQLNYQCGSNTLYGFVSVWMFAVVVVAIGACLWCLGVKREYFAALWRPLQVYWQATTNHVSDLPDYTQLYKMMEGLCMTAAPAYTLYAMVVLFPTFVALTQFYGIYEYQYAWTASAAFLSGTTSFVALFTTLLALLSLILLHYICTRDADNSDTALRTGILRAGAVLSSIATNLEYVEMTFTYIAINMVVVALVNFVYILVSLSASGVVVALVQILLAIFKVLFNTTCSPYFIRRASQYVLRDGSAFPVHVLVTVQLLVALINNIAIPCFVVAVISPDCFFYLFSPPAEVTSSFDYIGDCSEYAFIEGQKVTCRNPLTVEAGTSYQPLFQYSYHCSSEFITYYAPAFVNMCIIGGFGVPVFQLAVLYLHRRADPSTRWFRLLDRMLPRIFKPVVETGTPPEKDAQKPYYDPTHQLVNILTYLGLLLTFGAVFPPLAVCFAVAMISIVVFTRIKVGMYISAALQQNQPAYVTLLNDECVGVSTPLVLRKCLYMLFTASCLFYALFLFDTLGEEVGIYKSYWVLIVMTLLPVSFYVLHVCCVLIVRVVAYFMTDTRLNLSSRAAADVELLSVPADKGTSSSSSSSSSDLIGNFTSNNKTAAGGEMSGGGGLHERECVNPVHDV